MSRNSAATMIADDAGSRSAVPGDPGLLVETKLAPGEWMLATPGEQGVSSTAVRAAARELAARFGTPPPVPAVRRVRLDECLGLAVLHYCRGAVVLYCDEDDMPAAEAEGAIAAIVGETRSILVTASAGGDPVPVEFQVHDHGDGYIPDVLHDTPPLVLVEETATVHVCACMLSAELACVLSSLWTVMIGYLVQSPARI